MKAPSLAELFLREKKDIVVQIPKSRIEQVEAEERDVAQREAAGEEGISYYWEMGRLPKEDPERIYFSWDGAARAYHEVTSVDRQSGRIYMKTQIHEIDPIEMKPFRGFRYISRRDDK